MSIEATNWRSCHGGKAFPLAPRLDDPCSQWDRDLERGRNSKDREEGLLSSYWRVCVKAAKSKLEYSSSSHRSPSSAMAACSERGGGVGIKAGEKGQMQVLL